MKNIIISILSFYIMFGLFLFFVQNNFIYHPNNQDFKNCLGFSEYEKINFNETRFYYLNKNSSSIIVHYHGNAGSACDRAKFKDIFESTNKSIIYVEYAGYSNSELKPNKELILNDVKNVIEFTKDYENIIIYGESIGTGPASYHTKNSNVSKLILVSPFTKLSDVARSTFFIYPVNLMLKDNYNNLKWLEGQEFDLLILHGENDNIISPKLSKKLYNSINVLDKRYILVENYGHNNIFFSEAYKNEIINFLNT